MASKPVAVQFGAGNIGRALLGQVLHRAGYHITFVDVTAATVDKLNSQTTYLVKSLTEKAGVTKDEEITDYSAIDSKADVDAAISAVSKADIVTCAVGPNILQWIAPVIAKGLLARAAGSKPLVVIAFENMVNGTTSLKNHILAKVTEEEKPTIAEKAIFANAAVDRIVPVPKGDFTLDIVAEEFFEVVVEYGPFGGKDKVPNIKDIKFVEDLEPFIKRKLFSVNTGHASTAFVGRTKGIELIYDALSKPEIKAKVEKALSETKDLLVSSPKYKFGEEESQKYINTILSRFSNPNLEDDCVRVGRGPIRKLGYADRLIGPMSELAELDGNHPYDGLLEIVGYALKFVNVEYEEKDETKQDPESFELVKILSTETTEEAIEKIVNKGLGSDAKRLQKTDKIYSEIYAKFEAAANELKAGQKAE